MEKYVKKQDVIDALQKERDYLLKNKMYGAEHILVHHAMNVIDEMEPVDAQRVICCKDCRFSKGKTVDMWGLPVIECETGETHGYEWFCASAQRRKEE